MNASQSQSMINDNNSEVVVEYAYRTADDGCFWIDISADAEPWESIGPFDTETERSRVRAGLLAMMRSAGAQDLPGMAQ